MNPFYHRGALRRPSDFYGRTQESEQILGLLRNGQSVALVGPRRIGKSSLLLHLSRPEVRQPFGLHSPQALFVMVDCQELGGAKAEEVYELFYQQLADEAEAAGLELDEAKRHDTYRDLDRALNKVTRAGVAVVLMLDEFELLAGNNQLTPYFFARLRGLTTKYGLAYVTASQRPLFAITADEEILSSPFFNIFVSLSLGLYSAAEAEGLLNYRLQESGITFSPELTNHIINLVGHHPFFLHMAGYHAFPLVSEGQLATPYLIDKPLEVEAESHLAYLWQNLTEEERYNLAILEGSTEVMRQLEQQCLVIPTADKPGRFAYPCDLLRRFVRRQPVPGLIQASPFVIDQHRYRVHSPQGPLELTNSQFSLLVSLAEQAGQVVTAGELERAVWGEELVDDPDRLKTLIKRLRRAIEPYDNWVVSERGIGYALRMPEAEL